MDSYGVERQPVGMRIVDWALFTMQNHFVIAVAVIGGDHRDADGQWAHVREIADDGAILVRPDNYVAWRSMSSAGDPADILINAVGTVLHR